MMDPNNYYHKYHAVEVDYGSGLLSEDIAIKDKITKDVFCGEQCTENAQIFLELLEKSKARHLKTQNDQDLLSQSISEESEEINNISRIEMKDNNGESVIMDLNPKKFDKSKDNLFFDFFAIYAKNVIKDKKSNQPRVFHEREYDSIVQ